MFWCCGVVVLWCCGLWFLILLFGDWFLALVCLGCLVFGSCFRFWFWCLALVWVLLLV